MVDSTLRLTRDQLAEFLPNARAIKAFEALMLSTGTTLPDELTELRSLIEEANSDSASGVAKANLALANNSELASKIEMLLLAPVPVATEGEPLISPGTTAQYWRGDKTWRDFMTDVRATVLTGLSIATNAVITAADTVLSALGKLQKQFSDHFASTAEHGATGAVVGTTNTQTLTNKTLTTPNIIGISSGAAPGTGSVGETITAVGTSVALTSGTAKAVASVSLTAGNWLIFGAGNFDYGGGTTSSGLAVMLNDSATVPAEQYYSFFQFATSVQTGFVAPTRSDNFSGSKTWNLVMYATFSGGTLAGTGYITAIRIS